MAMWKNDDEMFALMKEKLYTPVVGDILDQMGYKHQFLPASIRPLAAQVPTAPYILPGETEDKRLRLAGYACTVLEKLIANKRRVQNIYCSVNRDVFESALMQVCGYLTGLYVDSAAQGFAISAQDRELVAGFYRGECFGLIMDWVMRGMPDNVLAYFHQLCTLRQGMTEHLLRRIHTDTE